MAKLARINQRCKRCGKTFKIADGHVCPKANNSVGGGDLADDAVSAGCCLAELGCWSLGCLFPILAGLLVVAFLHA